MSSSTSLLQPTATSLSFYLSTTLNKTPREVEETTRKPVTSIHNQSSSVTSDQCHA